MINFNATYRQAQILLATISFFILLSSFYFEYVQGLQPCPLCLMQRFCVMLFLLFCLLGIFVHSVKKCKGLMVACLLVALGGLYFAGRQLWLQSLPAGQVPACLPDLSVLLQYFPWSDLFQAFVLGSGDCAKVSWTWLGLSMPAWTALYFLLMVAGSLLVLCNL